MLVVDRRQERRVLSYALCDEPCSLSYAMHCVMLKARVAAAVESGVPAVIRNQAVLPFWWWPCCA